MSEFTVVRVTSSNGQTVTIKSDSAMIGRKFFNRESQANAWIDRKTSGTRRLRRQFAQTRRS